MSMRATTLAIALVATLACGPAAAGRAYVAIEQRLSPEQLHATGLDQLSSEQLALLNRLLQEEQDAAVAASAREPEGPIESAIRGDVRGWEKGTVFELDNGQRWRVVDGEYFLSTPLAHPKATVRPGALSSWYLRIEGISVGAKVRRVDTGR